MSPQCNGVFLDLIWWRETGFVMKNRESPPEISCKKKGYLMTAHCTCMAGCGEACSHVAAVLFAVDQLTRDGENCEEARTSIKCIWNSYCKEQVVPATVDTLDFSHPRHGRGTTKRKLKIRPI